MNEIPPWGKEPHLSCHITSPTICKKHVQTKICKDMNIKTDIPSQVADVYKNTHEMYIHMPHNC